MTIAIRAARPEDAGVCGSICYEAFKTVSERHNFPPDFPNTDVPTGLFDSILARDDVYAIVAESDGRVVGSNVLWEHNEIAGIGPITVSPDAQRDSIGRRLMEDVLERAESQQFAGVRLVQAAFNNLTMALYSKLGFDVREPLSCITGEPLQLTLPGFEVRAATADDTNACNALCRRVHGHDRAGDLNDALGQGTATVVERDGRITGYASVIGFFGHAVGETNDDLKALIGAAPEFAGPGMLLPTRNAEVLRWCLNRGLKIKQPMTLMSLGKYQEPEGAFIPSVLF